MPDELKWPPLLKFKNELMKILIEKCYFKIRHSSTQYYNVGKIVVIANGG